MSSVLIRQKLSGVVKSSWWPSEISPALAVALLAVELAIGPIFFLGGLEWQFRDRSSAVGASDAEISDVKHLSRWP